MHKHRLMWGTVLIVAVVAWVGWEIPQAWGQRARVPQTGQTACWDTAGNPIPCEGTGQDGDIQASVDWPTLRFMDRGNGTVRDNLTGLIWLKDPNCFGGRTWAQALTDANALASGSCGLTDGSKAGDRRLPNVKELRSLIDFDQSDPALPNGHPFLNLPSSWHWSSTTFAGFPASAWHVLLDVGNTNFSLKTNVWLVWPVRGGD